MKLCM